MIKHHNNLTCTFIQWAILISPFLKLGKNEYMSHEQIIISQKFSPFYKIKKEEANKMRYVTTFHIWGW